MTTTNKPMTGEQLDELMTVSVNMQRESEKLGDRSAAMFAYAVQVAVLELRSVRKVVEQLAAENSGLRHLLDKVSETGNANFGRTSLQTPATDAFLAEVRASGVEMFAENLTRKAIASGENKNHAYAYLAANFAAQLRQEAK